MDWKLCAHFSAFFLLLVSLQCSCNWKVQVNKGKNEKGQISWDDYHFRRQKREWIAPPTHLREAEDNRYRNPLAKVHSDIEVKKGYILYKAYGDGFDRPPFGLFVLDPKTGHLNVTGLIIDREEIAMLYFTVHALTTSGQDVEKPLEMRVKILDINDNPPIFSQSVFVGSIEERSAANSVVMQILASDADEENTINSQIAYKILSQSPSDPAMFIMSQKTGQVFTMSSTLDREFISSYSLVVSGSDLNGAAGGMSGQCGADIRIADVNDNFPVLEFDSYSVQVIENMIGFTDLRMNVFDADEMYSDNWLAVFDIVSGNDGGWFAIETDSHTNQGVLRIIKHLDYEAMSAANLGILVTNRAAFHQSVMSEYKAKVSNINVQVQDVKEGPVFVPSTIHVKIPSGLTQEQLLQYVLTKVTAMDKDTGGPATNVVYMLGNDATRWFIIDSTTGEVKMTYELSRDVPQGTNGNLTATILAIDNNLPTRTATATIVVDTGGATTSGSCPIITQEPRLVCLSTKTAILAAQQNPSNPPYKITLAPNSDFTVQPLNATAVTLLGSNSLSARNYTVLAYVTDNNNLSCPNSIPIPVQVCDCNPAGLCDALKQTDRNVALGPAAIGLMVLGFLALLLALLLLPICLCGAGAGTKFVPVASGYDGAFHQWGTEGAKPEDVDMTTMLINSGTEYESRASNVIGGAGGLGALGAGALGAAGGGLGAVGGGVGGASTTMFETTTGLGEGARDHRFSGESNMNTSIIGGLTSGAALNMAYVENYFAEKAERYADEDESRPANDCLLIYDNEGAGSLAGSVGCCSFIADDLDDDYLDTLGPKFKTLAEICIGSEIEPVLSGGEPRFANIPIVETSADVMVEESSLNIAGNRSVPITNSTYVNESSYSSTVLQPARPIPEPIIPGNVVVTETYRTSGGTLRPPAFSVNNSLPPNILVTERVVESTSGGQGVFSEIPDGSNVIVTERVVRPTSGVHEILELPNMSSLSDGSNVVLRERVIAPSSSRLSSTLNMPDLVDAQKVLVTERLIQQPNNSFLPSTFNMSEIGDAQNVVVTERVIQQPNNSRLPSTFNMAEIADSQNVVVMERVIQQPKSSRLPSTFNMAEIADSQNVVVTERVIQQPNNSRLPSTFNMAELGDAQSVVVTERVIQPVSNVQGNLTIRPDMGSSQNIYVAEKTVKSGPSVSTAHRLTAEPVIRQSFGSTSPNLTRSSVTKYSTVQYTKK